jgi:hypothetical protein
MNLSRPQPDKRFTVMTPPVRLTGDTLLPMGPKESPR